MEYIDGKSLRELIKKNGSIIPTSAINYVRQICEVYARASF